MKNTFGNSLTVTLFGESHGPAVGSVIDGIAPGIEFDVEYIKKKLELRKPMGKISTARHEDDGFTVISGVFGGRTTGTPLAMVINNSSTHCGDYDEIKHKPRPSHADYTAMCKYHGFADYRGGGHFSGRISAPLVAAGALIQSALEKKGIMIGTHISYLGGVSDRKIESVRDIEALSELYFPVLADDMRGEMMTKIEQAASEGDSIGGILETVIYGLPAGVGEPWFDTLEGTLAHILFSVPGIKGVEFGLGFGFANVNGSEANDGFTFIDGKVRTLTNNNGGINGGISNGEPIVIRCAVKPTPSIYKEQKTVDIKEGYDTLLTVRGRHDPAIIHRARAVVDAVCALAIGDMLTVRFGTDYLAQP